MLSDNNCDNNNNDNNNAINDDIIETGENIDTIFEYSINK